MTRFHCKPMNEDGYLLKMIQSRFHTRQQVLFLLSQSLLSQKLALLFLAKLYFVKSNVLEEIAQLLWQLLLLCGVFLCIFSTFGEYTRNSGRKLVMKLLVSRNVTLGEENNHCR